MMVLLVFMFVTVVIFLYISSKQRLEQALKCKAKMISEQTIADDQQLSFDTGVLEDIDPEPPSPKYCNHL